MYRSVRSLFVVLLAFGLAACSNDFVGSTDSDDEAAISAVSSTHQRHEIYPKFRHTQLLDRAYSRRGDVASKVDYPTVNLFIGFDEYEMNGVSRRVLDEYGISRRVLDQYGITRRVLDQYGITRRILDEYGITRRVLDQYGNVVSESPAIRARAGYGRAVQGVAVEVEADFLEDLLMALQSDPDIGYIEPDPVYEVTVPTLLPDPTDDGELVPWGVERIGGLLTDFDGGDIHVVMMDSGVNEGDDVRVDRERDISMLFQNRDQEYWDDTEFTQVTPAFEPGDDGDPRDRTGHGSHMASTVGAPQNGKGMRGVAPGVRLHNLKVMSDDGRTDITTLTAAIDHITWFKTDLKPELKLVVNMSLGADIESTAFNALDIAVQRAIDAGIVVVVAAGNDGADASTYSPAHVPDAITVGAFDPFDQFASFSNYGSFVDILAPGGDIPAVDHTGSLSAMDGTSSAAAYVTGAVAHYWSLNSEATPLEIRDALVESAQPVIHGTPEGTTNRALYIGDFAREWNDDEDFDIDAAVWNSQTGTLTVTGVGQRLNLVDVARAYTGQQLAGSVVGYTAEWIVQTSGLDPVPCDIRATSGDTTVQAEVSGAPEGCEQTPAFLSAQWRNGGVMLSATGTAGYNVSLTSTNTGTPLFSGTFDAAGQLSTTFTDFPEVPCSITMTAGPYSADLPVAGVSPNCDGNIHVGEVKWNRGALFLDMLGNPGATVALTSANTGVSLGTVTLAASGAFEDEVSDLSEIPCSLTVAMGDKSQTAPVVGAPDNCDSRPFLDRAEWRGSQLQLSGLANPNATVELWSVGLDRMVATTSADASGIIQGNVGGFSAVPCQLKLRMETPDGRTTWSDALQVSSAPLNCDGQDYLTLQRAEYDSGKRILKIQGTGLSGSPGQDVEIRYADGTLLFSITPDDDGAFQYEFKNLEAANSPCGLIDAGFVGGQTLVDDFQMGKSSSPPNCSR